ncbi:response regulator [Pedomonas mirosovicensis]|uniref:response regulator n=1 Tax=Pedomonas mirosovicensis TaxID=2908641 RepID=UPI0021692332|nr:response regulator [Pedomonas mirosovicensis]MCH8684965.1 response regulator [Pedomonas mirosovicensis]
MARILVAEDNAAVREFVERSLAHFGHTVVSVGDGGAALSCLNHEQFDLLITDIVMPVMDGIALALKASSVAPDMPVLMMTGYAHERQRAYNLQELIADVLDKPFSLEDLNTAVNRILSKHNPSAS